MSRLAAALAFAAGAAGAQPSTKFETRCALPTSQALKKKKG